MDRGWSDAIAAVHSRLNSTNDRFHRACFVISAARSFERRYARLNGGKVSRWHHDLRHRRYIKTGTDVRAALL
jgi:hypothetical protein